MFILHCKLENTTWEQRGGLLQNSHLISSHLRYNHFLLSVNNNSSPISRNEENELTVPVANIKYSIVNDTRNTMESFTLLWQQNGRWKHDK